MTLLTARQLTSLLGADGGRAVLPSTCALLHNPSFTDAALDDPSAVTIAYGEFADAPGVHVMEAAGARWVEALSGLGGAGVHLIIAYRPPGKAGGLLPAHPMVPTLAVTEAGAGDAQDGTEEDVDVLLPPDAPASWLGVLLKAVGAIASGARAPHAQRLANVDFQIARGGAVSL